VRHGFGLKSRGVICCYFVKAAFRVCKCRKRSLEVETTRVTREVPTKVGQSEALGYSFATALYAVRQSASTNPTVKRKDKV
jgi:hypothetical protein